MRELAVSNRTMSLFKVILTAILAVALMAPATAFADPTSTEKQAEAQAALASLDAMQERLSKASDDHYTAQEEQKAAETKVKEAQALIDETNAEIASVQEKLGTRASSMYRSGSMSFLDLLMGSGSFEEFATNLDLLDMLNQKDADMVQRSKELREEVEAQQKVLADEQVIATAKAQEAEQIMKDAQATTDAMQATYDSLSAEATELLNQERAARIAVEEANAQAVVDAAIDNANKNTNTGNNNTGNSNTGGNSGFTPGYNPVTGNAVVDRAFGCIGAGYDMGAVGPSTFDCSGLVSYALTGSYSRLGNTYTFLGWQEVSDPQPGDIAVNSGHCGIYIGNGQMIHAATYGVGVVQGPVQGGMIFVRY